jgi:hypothetical protein
MIPLSPSDLVFILGVPALSSGLAALLVLHARWRSRVDVNTGTGSRMAEAVERVQASEPVVVSARTASTVTAP